MARSRQSPKQVLSNRLRSTLARMAKRQAGKVEEAFDMGLMKEFMKALSNSAGLDLHVTIHYGEDIHHAIESIYKALGRALCMAVAKDPRIKGVLSTKGKL